MNLMSSLNITSGALSVNEKAISVVSHNVSNMNTEGYHKQRVNLQARNIAGQIGDNPYNQVRANGGVKIANVMRYNDEYLNNYYRTQLSEKNKLEQQLGDLDELAGIFDDLEGTGIDSALSDFYDALNNLNQYPASATARTNFVERAKTLTKIMNTKSIELNKLTGAALGDGDSEESLKNSRIYTVYKDFNTSLDELAAVNKALQTTQTGTLTANNLLDKRDLILHDISQFVDITVDEKANGSVNVYTGDMALVKGATVTGKLDIKTAKEVYGDDWRTITQDPAIINLVDENGGTISVDINADITGGAIGGLIHSNEQTTADGSITPGTIQTQLDKLANQIAKVFNELNTDTTHAFAINPDDTTKLTATTADNYIFVNDSGTDTDITAGNIRINPELYKDNGIWNIACAYFEDPSHMEPEAVGNSQNVVNMLATRNTKYPDPGGLSGMSIEEYYASMLGKIASAGDSTRTQYETQCDVVDSLENQLDSAYGVDLNEELIDLVKYQTAYAAAAQVFNVVNSCLDTLMTLGR